MHIHHAEQYHQDQALRRVPETSAGEIGTRWVLALTSVTMIVEIVAGHLFNSMALLADGWHMVSHVGALGITLAAYAFDRRHAANDRFTFGTGKVGALGGFASAVALGLVAVLMVWESGRRLLEPLPIAFDQAMMVAAIGLVVNLISARLLHASAYHHHHHGHGHGHGRGHGHEYAQDSAHHVDHNVRAAYLHVLADAMTSVLAIGALFAGKVFGWAWADAVMGMVGAAVIAHWAVGLALDTGRVLLDGAVDPARARAIRTAIESDADNRVTDLHVWSVRPGTVSAIVAVVTHWPRPPEHYKALLGDHTDLVHVTVEVHAAPGEPCLPLPATARDESGPGASSSTRTH